MLMIVAHHYAYYGVLHSEYGDNYQIWADGALLNKIATVLLVPGGEIGVACFFMITGFYMYKQNEVSLKKIIKIATEVYFYAIVTLIIYLFAKILGYEFASISTAKQLMGIVRIIFIPNSSGSWWYITAYIALIVLIPQINQIVSYLNTKGTYVLIFSLWFFWYTVGKIGAPFYIFYRAVFFYIIGASLASQVIKIAPTNLCTVLLISAAGWASFAALEYAIAHLSVSTENVSLISIFSNSCELVQTAISVPLSAIPLFVFFIQKEMGYCKTINSIASSTFGIYLLHSNSLITPFVWNYLFNVGKLQYTSSAYIVLGGGGQFWLYSLRV